MDVKNDIKTRTFGVEIEMCNFDRQAIILPNGFEWDEEEKINNTDSFIDKRYGGEINSSPLIYNEESIDLLKGVVKQVMDAGGKIIWNLDLHVHLYAGDLNVEQLKRLIMFEYCCYPFFKKYCKFQDWNELCITSKPLITEDKYMQIKDASDISGLKSILTNNSRKGFIRYAINIASFFVHNTVEFRCFKATDDIEKMRNCILGAYAMFYYAINHTEEDFKRIGSYEEFVETVGLLEPTPDAKIPLLFQGNPYKLKDTYRTPPLSFNSKQASALYYAVKDFGIDELCVVNGFWFYYELFFLDKVRVSIYSQDAYCHLLYLIANGKVILKYNGKLSWLEEYNNSTVGRQTALALYAGKLQKTFMSDSVRNDAVFEALKIKAKESIEETESKCDKLIRLLTTCKYHIGTLQDAISREKAILFNYGVDKQQKRAYKLIRENSDLDMDYQVDRNDFSDLVESLPKESYLFYFRESPYLDNMYKLTMWNSQSGERRSAGRFLYCNKSSNHNKVNTSYKSNFVEVNEIIPPDNLSIDNPQLLKIERVNSSYLYCLQKKYIKKVDQVSKCMNSFVVMYGKYTLGGFGFTLPQHKGYDLFQLTDFCTNNAIPKLSKFILYCIQTKEVQRILSRSMHKLVEKVISCAYTHKPVSMKYRGVYTKVKEHCTSSYLAYSGQLGVYENYTEVIEKYHKLLENGQRK